MPHELDSSAVLSPAARIAWTAACIGSAMVEPANIRVSRPSATIWTPLRRAIREASSRSNSSTVHSPRSRAWIGLASPFWSYAPVTQGRITVA